MREEELYEADATDGFMAAVAAIFMANRTATDASTGAIGARDTTINPPTFRSKNKRKALKHGTLQLIGSQTEPHLHPRHTKRRAYQKAPPAQHLKNYPELLTSPLAQPIKQTGPKKKFYKSLTICPSESLATPKTRTEQKCGPTLIEHPTPLLKKLLNRPK